VNALCFYKCSDENGDIFRVANEGLIKELLMPLEVGVGRVSNECYAVAIAGSQFCCCECSSRGRIRDIVFVLFLVVVITSLCRAGSLIWEDVH
jgi:hypothetical protein